MYRRPVATPRHPCPPRGSAAHDGPGRAHDTVHRRPVVVHKRAELDSTKHANNNIPDILARWRERQGESTRPRTAQSFLVPKSEIAANDYDLSINRYKEVVYDEIIHDSPQVILQSLNELEIEIQNDLRELEMLLK